MTLPIYTTEEAQHQQIFQALLQALSYPGRPQTLPTVGDSFAAIGATLIDLETSFYTPDPALAAALAPSGARQVGPDRAAYQFFPLLRESDLEQLTAAPIGSYTYPDEGATLVIGCQFGGNTLLRLSGPGVPGVQELRIGGVPEAFWELRRAQIRYPLGWDVFLVAEQAVVGVPRSAVVEVL